MTNSASARIGWTLQDCEDHFGPPVNTDWSEGPRRGYTFKHGGMTIEVYFDKAAGKVNVIEYRLPRPFFVEEIIDLMKKNIEGTDMKWIETPDKSPITDDKVNPVGYDQVYTTTQDPEGFFIECRAPFYPNRPPRSVMFTLIKGSTSGL